jgi:hypothetical protein
MTLLLASLGFFDFMMIALIVIVFGGSAAAIHRVDLRRLDRKLDALLKHQDISLPPVVSEEVQRILRDPTKKDEAIKLHGEQTGLDVEDSTADVQEFLAGKH